MPIALNIGHCSDKSAQGLDAIDGLAIEWLEADAVPDRLRPLIGTNSICEVNVVGVRTTISDLCLPPRDAYDAYLRLHLLSHRMIRPHDANFDGVEDLLADVVWTNHGPVAADDFSSAASAHYAR